MTQEVKWLVETFWEGLRCNVMVPCIAPCGRGKPGTALFDVAKLFASKSKGRSEYPCPVCDEWQDIDDLLRNAPEARRAPLEMLLAELATERRDLREQLVSFHGEDIRRFDRLDTSTQRILSKVDEAFTGLMQTLTDEAKEGPRLYSFEPMDLGFLDKPKWISAKFRLRLWCEHSRLPLTMLNEEGDTSGVYELDLPRKWLVKAAPFLKILTGTLGIVAPMAFSATKMVVDDAAYKAIEKELDLGQKCFDAMIKGTEKAIGWQGDIELEHGRGARSTRRGASPTPGLAQGEGPELRRPRASTGQTA